MGGPARRVFISHTSELRRYPVSGSFVAAAERAVKRAGDVPVGMERFAAGEQPPVGVCRAQVAACDVYVLVAGFRYGVPVRDGSSMSYPELEFETATGLGKPRLVLLLDEEAEGTSALFRDPESGARQEAFRRRLLDSGLGVEWVRTPAELEAAVARALDELPTSDTGSVGDGAAGEPLLGRLPAEAERLEDKLHSLRELDSAIHEQIVRQDYAAAQQFVVIARKHALEALEAALACVALPSAGRGRFSADAIRHAEQLLRIAPGTFSSFFAVNLGSGGQEKTKALEELLVEVRDRIDSTPVDKEPHAAPPWLPAVLRIGSAVLVATAVGAPLGALAVGEPVVKEIVKAGIAVAAGVIAAEVTNHAVERWLNREVAHDPSAPLEPTPPVLADTPRGAPVLPSNHALAEPTLPHLEPQDLESPVPGPAAPIDLDEPPNRRFDDPVSNFDDPVSDPDELLPEFDDPVPEFNDPFSGLDDPFRGFRL